MFFDEVLIVHIYILVEKLSPKLLQHDLELLSLSVCSFDAINEDIWLKWIKFEAKVVYDRENSKKPANTDMLDPVIFYVNASPCHVAKLDGT